MAGRMRGDPWTYGPDKKGRIMAVAACVGCDAQLQGPWKKGDDRKDARNKAKVALKKMFEEHNCITRGTGLFCATVVGQAK